MATRNSLDMWMQPDEYGAITDTLPRDPARPPAAAKPRRVGWFAQLKDAYLGMNVQDAARDPLTPTPSSVSAFITGQEPSAELKNPALTPEAQQARAQRNNLAPRMLTTPSGVAQDEFRAGERAVAPEGTQPNAEQQFAELLGKYDRKPGNSTGIFKNGKRDVSARSETNPDYNQPSLKTIRSFKGTITDPALLKVAERYESQALTREAQRAVVRDNTKPAVALKRAAAVAANPEGSMSANAQKSVHELAMASAQREVYGPQGTGLQRFTTSNRRQSGSKSGLLNTAALKRDRAALGEAYDRAKGALLDQYVADASIAAKNADLAQRRAELDTEERTTRITAAGGVAAAEAKGRADRVVAQVNARAQRDGYSFEQRLQEFRDAGKVESRETPEGKRWREASEFFRGSILGPEREDNPILARVSQLDPDQQLRIQVKVWDYLRNSNAKDDGARKLLALRVMEEEGLTGITEQYLKTPWGKFEQGKRR